MNRAKTVEAFKVAVWHLDERWVNVTPERVALMPGEHATVAITIAPPATFTSRAGIHEFRIVAIGESDVGPVGVDAVVQVASFALAHGTLAPVTVRRRLRRARFALQITNLGNDVRRWRVETYDPDDRLRLDHRRNLSEVEPGGSVSAKVRVGLRGQRVAGDDHPFRIDVVDPTTEEVAYTADAHVVVARTPRLIGVLGVVAALVVIAWFSIVKVAKPVSSASELVTTTVPGATTVAGAASTVGANPQPTTTAAMSASGVEGATAPTGGSAASSGTYDPATAPSSPAAQGMDTTPSAPSSSGGGGHGPLSRSQPSITSALPGLLAVDPFAQKIEVVGDHLASTATEFLLNLPGTTIVSTSVSDDQHATVTVSATGGSVNTSGSLSVRTPDGESPPYPVGVGASMGATPVVSQQQGTTNTTVTITGAGLQGATVAPSATMGSTSVTIDVVDNTADDHLTIQVTVPGAPAPSGVIATAVVADASLNVGVNLRSAATGDVVPVAIQLQTLAWQLKLLPNVFLPPPSVVMLPPPSLPPPPSQVILPPPTPRTTLEPGCRFPSGGYCP
jgi:hypothetical protein